MKKLSRHKVFVEEMLTKADIQVNGNRPFDIRVHNEDFYARVIAGGSLAFGESYMDGWWDCDDLAECVARIERAGIPKQMKFNAGKIRTYISALLSTRGKKWRAFEVGEKHYDTGNDLFSVMLDKRLVYTCAYWKNATTLDEAQEAKLDLVCRKIGLQAGQKVLDIGCGWASFAKFAAEKYGAHVVGVSVSKEQIELGRKLCEGLPVELRLQDYRDVNEEFDHIVSLGMFEHVGSKQYATYMEVARRCLKDGGLFLLHTIGRNDTKIGSDPWIEKYIFPGGEIPSIKNIGRAIENRFVMEDWHNFGPYYDLTLCAWNENFEKHWSTLEHSYSERFRRMWRYYLLTCAGAFRARKLQLWQVVLSKNGVSEGYFSVR